jgi:hypothetical protein
MKKVNQIKVFDITRNILVKVTVMRPKKEAPRRVDVMEFSNSCCAYSCISLQAPDHSAFR